MSRFMAALRHCATISSSHRRGTPSSSQQKATEPANNIPFKPIQIDRQIFQNQHEVPAVTGLEIVPWQPPCPHAIALEYWPIIVEARRRAVHTTTQQLQVNQNVENESAIQSEDVNQSGSLTLNLVATDGNQGPSFFSPATFEFQSNQIQHSPTSIRGRKKKTVRASNVVSLPLRIADPASPLVETSVRRCTRLKRTDGFCEVRLSKEPNKKQKICVIEIDEKTGKTGPVSLPVLQSWGLNCGVAPGELSEDALMQAPTPAEPSANDAPPPLLATVDLEPFSPSVINE
jgi:hypothetical protein